MSDTLAARRARKGFFAAKAVAAKAAANDAAIPPRPHGPVPAGRFEVQIGMIPGSSTHPRLDGSVEIRDALIVDAATGNEIDGMTVLARGAVGRQITADPQIHGAPIEGFAIVGDDGYELVQYHGSLSIAMAA